MKSSRSFFYNLTTLSVSLTAVVLMAACSQNSDNAEPGPVDNTGAADIEAQVAPQPPAAYTEGTELYISAERVRVRTTPEITDSNIAGTLELNDKVEIVDSKEIGSQKFVGIKVLETSTSTPKDKTVYIAEAYLNSGKVTPTPQVSDGMKITVITNIATQKVRIYRACEPSEHCRNKMLIEQDVVTGEDRDEMHTNVGSYRVEHWNKFYETPGVYPAWYKAGSPALPPIGSHYDWVSSKYMPNGKGDMRGAFGWYTAFVGPNPNGQWFHGTSGWGADKKSFTLFRYSLLGRFMHIFMQIDSHGCTRTDNETIAFARTNVPLGARYLKVYAKEGLRDPSRAGYSQAPGAFDYIITKRDAQVRDHNEPADRATVLRDGTPQSEWLEQGTLSVDAYPKPIAYRGSGARSGDNYDLGKNAFTGVFLVDEGTFVGYKHPVHEKIIVGGFKENGRAAELPSQNVSSDTNYTIPTR